MKTITLVTKKKNQGKKKRSQNVSNKGRKNERKKIKSQHIGDLKVNFKGIFGSSFHEFLPQLSPTIYFPSSPPNQTH